MKIISEKQQYLEDNITSFGLTSYCLEELKNNNLFKPNELIHKLNYRFMQLYNEDKVVFEVSQISCWTTLLDFSYEDDVLINARAEIKNLFLEEIYFAIEHKIEYLKSGLKPELEKLQNAF